MNALPSGVNPWSSSVGNAGGCSEASASIAARKRHWQTFMSAAPRGYELDGDHVAGAGSTAWNMMADLLDLRTRSRRKVLGDLPWLAHALTPVPATLPVEACRGDTGLPGVSPVRLVITFS